MRRKRYSEEQIISILKEQQAGTPVPELAHRRRLREPPPAITAPYRASGLVRWPSSDTGPSQRPTRMAQLRSPAPCGGFNDSHLLADVEPPG
jgi:hypothetical protein